MHKTHHFDIINTKIFWGGGTTCLRRSTAGALSDGLETPAFVKSWIRACKMFYSVDGRSEQLGPTWTAELGDRVSGRSAVVSDEEDGEHHGRDDDELVQADEAQGDQGLGPGDRLRRGQRGVDERHADAEPDGVLPLSHRPVRPATTPPPVTTHSRLRLCHLTAFGALALLVGRQEGHPACKKN